MADLRSKEVTSVPSSFDDLKIFLEEHLRSHFEDLKQLKEMIDMVSGFRFRKDSSGDLIIEEFIVTSGTWEATGQKWKSMQ